MIIGTDVLTQNVKCCLCSLNLDKTGRHKEYQSWVLEVLRRVRELRNAWWSLAGNRVSGFYPYIVCILMVLGELTPLSGIFQITHDTSFFLLCENCFWNSAFAFKIFITILRSTFEIFIKSSSCKVTYALFLCTFVKVHHYLFMKLARNIIKCILTVGVAPFVLWIFLWPFEPLSSQILDDEEGTLVHTNLLLQLKKYKWFWNQRSQSFRVSVKVVNNIINLIKSIQVNQIFPCQKN
jgi:hypothetical protein